MNGTDLYFADGEFDQVVTIATLHHISDEEALDTIRAARRVCRNCGPVHVIEAIYPLNRYKVLNYLIFALDRGSHQRSFGRLLELISSEFPIDTIEAKPGFPHDVCYISIPATSSSETLRPVDA